MLILDNFRYQVQSCTEVDRETCVWYRYTGLQELLIETENPGHYMVRIIAEVLVIFSVCMCLFCRY